MHDPRHPIRLSLLTLAMILAVTLCGCGSDSSNSPFNPNTTDQAPPLPPGGARIDWQMQGKFALAWNRNTEPDLAGYRVYLYSPDPERSNAYTCMSGAALLTKSTFTIAWTGQTSYIFRVTAVDASGNESPMSEQLTYQYPTTTGTLPSDQGNQGDGGSSGGGSSTRGGGSTRPDEQGDGGYRP
jgi:hypothetical protein